MIVVKLLGGLGNQLFQYAAGRALADKYGSELYMDMSYFTEKHGMTPRPFELDKLNCGIRTATPKQIDRIINRNRSQKFADTIFRIKRFHIRENQEFPPSLPGQKIDLFLDGYWQSENYFRGIEKTIRSEFVFTRAFNPETERLGAEIRKSERPVSVHIRRGDYLASEAMKNWLGVCSVEYYQKAFAHLSNRIGQPFYYVFSDDLDWVNEHIIQGNTNMQAVSHNRGGDSWQDMYLMSLCNHHIIANSSFSWWGAWLDPHPEKIVIAPDKWFLSSTLYDQIKNIVPEGWVRF